MRPPLPREVDGERMFQNIVSVDKEEHVITISENLNAVLDEVGRKSVWFGEASRQQHRQQFYHKTLRASDALLLDLCFLLLHLRAISRPPWAWLASQFSNVAIHLLAITLAKRKPHVLLTASYFHTNHPQRRTGVWSALEGLTAHMPSPSTTSTTFRLRSGRYATRTRNDMC